MTDTANKDNGDMNNKKKSYSDKRKRINRIKTALIITILVLILIPTILCIFLGMRLSRLEKKLELLTYNLGMQDELDYTRSDSRYAYASDFGPDEIINTSKDVANEDLINKDLINKDVIGKDSIDTDVTGNQNVNDKIIKEEDYIKQANNITEESIHIQNIDNNVGNKNPGNNNPGNNNPVNNNPGNNNPGNNNPGNNTATNNNINSNIDINNNDNKNYNYDLNKDKDIDIDKDI
ncbi:MAG: hypothetical protein GX321_08305, partial [Clostridiales bacterium]|nr:hypothetical protein [Clostridiales bacterium]